jgi:alpha-ribazole phosphatase/probable phosphoglycerate mutase
MELMSHLIFIRHGETGMAGTFCGHSDPELNLPGERQIARVAEEAAGLGIQRIYSSSLKRASRTANAVSERIGVKIERLHDLREIHFGLWEGLNWQEIEARFPREAERWMREFPLRSAPGGEAYEDFTARIEGAISRLLKKSVSVNTAVVTHRGVMRHALTRFFGFSEEEAWTRTGYYGAVVTVPLLGTEICAQTNYSQDVVR